MPGHFTTTMEKLIDAIVSTLDTEPTVHLKVRSN